METIRVIARAEAREGHADELKQTLRQLVLPTRSEHGCRYYEFFESQIPGVFYFHELWDSKSDLNAHAGTPRFHEVMAAAEKLLKVPMEVNLVTEVE
jgi:quinol monooxygenase YgiN